MSTPHIAAEMSRETGKQVHPQNVRRIVKAAGFNGRIPKKKTFVSEKNIDFRES